MDVRVTVSNLFQGRGAVAQVAAVNWREKALLLWMLLAPFFMMAILYAQSLKAPVKTVHCQQSILSACHVLADAYNAPLQQLVGAAAEVIRYNDNNNFRRETKFYNQAFDGYASGYKFAVSAGMMMDSEKTYSMMADYEAQLRDAAIGLLDIIGTYEV